MNTSKVLFLIVVACVLAAGGIYAYAYIRGHQVPSGTQSTSTPNAKVSTASIEDGTYVARIRTITTSPEDTTITFTHVTYFEGTEASSSATQEVTCKDQPIEACVPTLTRGYYVRESGTSPFTAPLTEATMLRLHDNAAATTDSLQEIERQFDPVFDVVIANGVVVSISEKSPK